MRILTRVIALTAGVAVAAACGSDSTRQTSSGSVSRSWNPLDVKEVHDIDVAALRAELEGRLSRKVAHATDEEWGHVRRLYKQYQSSPLWFDDDGLIKRRADAMVDALVNATSDAIAIDSYGLIELAQVLDSMRRAKDPTAVQIARADILLTTAFASLGEDYLTGQLDPRSVGQSWHIDPQDEEVDSALARSIRDKDLAEAIGRMRPQDAEYNLLREKLTEYRKIVSDGGWAPIPAGKSLKRGDRETPARLQALRNRLRAEGINVAGAGNTHDSFDESLAAGVAEYQKRHAIVVDSQLGSETMRSMNIPAAFRLAQIAANLDRYRWMPRALGAKFIRVNVPAFRLEGFENGRKTIEMKVIVGAEYEGRATPVFSDRMEYVVFRPYWDVPPSIAANEFTSGIPSDFDVSSRNGLMHLRQRPGPKNALGLVKFMFPNDFNIYLHDTPNDKLFDRDVRAFSHGCIRLEKPDEMAQWVLGWDESRVRQAMESGPNDRTVKLPAKIPVYIGYFTTFVRDGQLWFGNDLYDRDTDLARMVAAAAVPSANAALAIKALRRLTD
jgi:murein L,D-transpeptidase YcbB/YkuD